MNKKLITPIILSGGKGARLWPMSRASRPKQFLPLTGDLSLFQQSLLRLKDKKTYNAPIIITNNEYRFLVAEQALECGIDLAAILLEPVARNTAPAITAATILASKDNKNQLVHILPSDHDIIVDDAYLRALQSAKTATLNSRLVTFGITPNEPATGFGHIKTGKKEAWGTHVVSRFIEKPDLANAKKMLASGDYYWNSGMFLFAADVFLKECKKLAPKIFDAANFAVKNAKKDLDFIRLNEEAFAKSPNISVDYAIFEKTSLASLVPSPIIWSDLGSWDAVWKNGKRDENENIVRGQTYLNDTTNSLIVSEDYYIVVDGLDDIAVIASEDAIYVGQLSKAQNVGAIVKQLEANPKTANLTQVHKTTYRPWGGYSSILNGERFQVKRLFVESGKRLPLQKHHHRSEHWIIVRGTAEVQIDGKTMILNENESVYIPQGSVHRLYNPSKTLLELIEVQTGW